MQAGSQCFPSSPELHPDGPSWGGAASSRVFDPKSSVLGVLLSVYICQPHPFLWEGESAAWW